MVSGLEKVTPDHRDYSLLHTFGAIAPDPKSLPQNFSIYNGELIPNQNAYDIRFNPILPPLPYGCTGETGSFESGLQDNALYSPKDLYDNTPPIGYKGGRDMRTMLQTLIDRGPRKADGTFGPKRAHYFNCYGSGAIDDFDAARIALWLFQDEKRGVYIGSWWYPEWEKVGKDGILPVPSFNIRYGNGASQHAHLITGWKTFGDKTYLEDISWQGDDNYAANGITYFSREIFNACMAQVWTGAFTVTKNKVPTPIPIGHRVYLDHLIYFIKQLFLNHA